MSTITPQRLSVWQQNTPYMLLKVSQGKRKLRECPGKLFSFVNTLNLKLIFNEVTHNNKQNNFPLADKNISSLTFAFSTRSEKTHVHTNAQRQIKQFVGWFCLSDVRYEIPVAILGPVYIKSMDVSFSKTTFSESSHGYRYSCVTLLKQPCLI